MRRFLHILLLLIMPAALLVPFSAGALEGDHVPGLLLNQDQINLIKRKIAEVSGGCGSTGCKPVPLSEAPDMAGILNGIRARVDKWMELGIPIPVEGGEWTHLYVCAQSGTPLRYDPESPRRHFCQAEDKWYEDEIYYLCWVDFTHIRNIETALEAAILYRISGEEKYGVWAKNILMQYAGHYALYPRHGTHAGMGRITAQALDEAVWMISAAQTLDLLMGTGVMGDDDAGLVISKLLVPGANHIHLFPFGVHNIQCWISTAEYMIGLLSGRNNLIESGRRMIKKNLDEGVLGDGFWYEGSIGYHLYALRPLAGFALAAKNHGDELADHPRLKKMFSFPMSVAMPDGRLPALNDGGPNMFLAALGPYIEVAVSLWGGEFAPQLAYLQRSGFYNRNSRETLLFNPLAASDKGLESPGSIRSPESGLDVLRRGGNQYVLLKYGPPKPSGHDHPDRLSFIFWTHGLELAPDPGTPPYGHPLYRGWYHRTAAHNALLIDGRDQKVLHPCRPLGFGETTDFSFTGAECGMEDPKGAVMRRVLILLDGMLVDLFQVVALEDHRFDLLYHLYGEFENGWEGNSGADLGHISPYIQTLGGLLVSAPVTVRGRAVFEGGEKIGIQFKVVPLNPLNLILAQGPGRTPGENMPILAQELSGREAVFVTAIKAPGESGEKGIELRGASPRNSMVTLSMSMDGEEKTLAVNLETGDVSVSAP